VISPANMPRRRGSRADAPGASGGGEAAAGGGGTVIGGGQRFGRIVDRQPSGSGPGGRMGTYFVRDDETATTYSFSYADIVTEGFRTIRTGERVRFLIDQEEPDHAVYVIRLDLPAVEDLYR
jgi:hypothetical protein